MPERNVTVENRLRRVHTLASNAKAPQWVARHLEARIRKELEQNAQTPTERIVRELYGGGEFGEDQYAIDHAVEKEKALILKEVKDAATRTPRGWEQRFQTYREQFPIASAHPPIQKRFHEVKQRITEKTGNEYTFWRTVFFTETWFQEEFKKTPRSQEHFNVFVSHALDLMEAVEPKLQKATTTKSAIPSFEEWDGEGESKKSRSKIILFYNQHSSNLPETVTQAIDNMPNEKLHRFSDALSFITVYAKAFNVENWQKDPRHFEYLVEQAITLFQKVNKH